MVNGDPGHDLRHIRRASAPPTITVMLMHAFGTTAARRAPSRGGQGWGEIGEYAVLSWAYPLTVPAMALALLLRPVADMP